MLFFRVLKNIKYKFKNYWNILKRLFHWIPIIIKDRDWDYYHIFNILEFKLERTKKYLSSRELNDDSGEIDLAIKLIQKVKTEFYRHEYLSYSEIKTELVDYGEEGYEVKSEIIWERYDEYIMKNLSSVRKMKKFLSKKVDYFDSEGLLPEEKEKIAMDICIHKHEKCKRILFNYLAHKIEGWWN